MLFSDDEKRSIRDFLGTVVTAIHPPNGLCYGSFFQQSVELNWILFLHTTNIMKEQALFPCMDWVEAKLPVSAGHWVILHQRSRNKEQDHNHSRLEMKNLW